MYMYVKDQLDIDQFIIQVIKWRCLFAFLSRPWACSRKSEIFYRRKSEMKKELFVILQYSLQINETLR